MKFKMTCQHCGKEYYVEKSQLHRTKFCSDKCFRNSRNTQTEYNCDHCGRPFYTTRKRIERRSSGELKYLCCSKDCAKDIQRPHWSDIESLFRENDYDLISDKYINAKTKLDYICKKHPDRGVQSITYGNLRYGFGCRYCGFESTASHRRLSYSQVKDIFARHDMELLDGQQYSNTSDCMAYICVHHREFGVQYMTVSNAYKNRCPHCKKSKGEARISDFLSKNNIKFQSQVKFNSLLGVGGGGLSYDFFLPDYNLLIEYQGEFHDGTSGLQSKEEYSKQVEHDKRKREYARENNIALLEIWYKDFKKIESILKDKLLES